MIRKLRRGWLGVVLVAACAIALAPGDAGAARSIEDAAGPSRSPRDVYSPSGKDTSNSLSASIGGTVTHGATGAPIGNVVVAAWLNRGAYWEMVAAARTGPAGAYVIQGLDSGSYRIEFSDPNLVHEWYDDVWYPEQATTLPLSAGQNLAEIDAELVGGGKIAGTVLEAGSGAPSAFNIPVHAYRREGAAWKEFMATSTSVNTGRYTLGSLAAGVYRVKFDGGAIYVTEYFDNATSLAGADDVAVSAGSTTTDINARLQEAPVALDEELALLTDIGRILVRDPYAPPNVPPVTWQSPTVGWQQLAAGDFNGDGADELVALKDTQAQVFDPVVRGCKPAVDHEFTAPGPWRQAVTGDLDGDGRDELVMAYELPAPSTGMEVVAFDPGFSGVQWTQVWRQVVGAPFRQFATGDLNGDGDDELAGIRNLPDFSSYQIVIWDPSDAWAILHEGSYAFEWVALAIGDPIADPDGLEELVLSRNPGTFPLDSYGVFRCCDGAALIGLASARFTPPFTGIATGDVNASGDDEVYLLRSGMAAGQPVVALTSRNYGSDPAIEFGELIGQTRFRQVAAGDLDGDGKAEVVVSSPDTLLVYVAPESSVSSVAYAGAYDQNGAFVIGDFDGPNESACMPIYVPLVSRP